MKCIWTSGNLAIKWPRNRRRQRLLKVRIPQSRDLGISDACGNEVISRSNEEIKWPSIWNAKGTLYKICFNQARKCPPAPQQTQTESPSTGPSTKLLFLCSSHQGQNLQWSDHFCASWNRVNKFYDKTSSQHMFIMNGIKDYRSNIPCNKTYV